MDRSDIFISVLGPRYGTIPAGETVSVVALEYRRAVARDKPRILFLMAEDSSDWSTLGAEPDAAKAALLHELRAEFEADRLRDLFDSPGDLAMKVATALLPDLMADLALRDAENRQRVMEFTDERGPAGIALIADPAHIPADGSHTSTVTAKVTDAGGAPVADNEPLIWSFRGPVITNQTYSATQNGTAQISVRPETGSAWGRFIVICIAPRSGVAASIAVDFRPSGGIAPARTSAEEIPTFALQLAGLTRLERAFKPEFGASQLRGDPVAVLAWRFRGPRFQMPWRQVAGADLTRTRLANQFDLAAVPLDDALLATDELGLELRFPCGAGWAHELHRFPLTRQDISGKAVWNIGDEAIPPETWVESS